MDWLNQAKRFLGNLFGGAQRTIGQISGGVARAVGQAEQQAARVAQQAVQRVVPQAPRIQLPQVPRIQFPQIQLPQPPRVQLPQAPKIDLAAVGQALQGFQQGAGRTLGQIGTTAGQVGQGMGIGFKQITGQQLTPQEQQVVNVARQVSPIYKTATDIQKTLQEQDRQVRERQIQANKEFIQQFKTSPATAIFTMPALSPFGNVAQAYRQFKVATGQELPKFDTTKAVEDLSNTLAQSELRKIPGMGTVSDIVKPLAMSAARMADVAQTQEQYSNGIKGLGEMGLDIANIGSLLYTGGLSKQLFGQGLKQFGITAAKLAPRLAASGAGQNILNQLAQGKKLSEIDPKEVAAAAALYTGLGIGIPAATTGAGALTKKVMGAFVPTAQVAKAAQALPADKNALVIAGSLPEKGALRAQGYTNVQVQFQPKPGQVAPTLPVKPIYETAPKPGKPESFNKLIKSGQISAEEAKQVQALGMTPKDYLDMKAQPQMPFPRATEGQMPSFMQPLKPGEVRSKFANQLEFDAGVPDKVLTDIFPGYKPLANETVYKSAVKNLNQNQESIVQNLIAGKLPSTAENNATAMIAMRRLIDAEDFKKATELAQATIAKGTDAGRAVQIFARWRATTPEGALLKAQKVVNEVNTKLPMNKKIELGREKVLKIQDIANKIQQLGEGTRERQVQEALLAKEIMDVVPPGKLRKISTLQTMAQLLNAKTAIRNILGNAAAGVSNDVSNFVGSGVDAALFKLGLVKQRTVVMPSLTAGAKGFIKGIKFGAEDVKLGIKTSGAAGGYDIQPQIFKNAVLRKLENAMGYELSVPDKAFYQRAFDTSLNNQMRAAAKSGQAVDKPTAQMIAQANEEGLYQTFQNNSGLANALVQVKHWLNAGKDFGAGDFILKYPKTPGNIVSQGIDFTPIGIGKGVYQLVNAARTATLNPITQRQAILNIGRGLTGTGLLSLGAVLANVGIMTADKNVNKNVNALDVIQGGGPFRLNVSALQRFATGGDPAAKEGDVTVNYDWLQPNAIQLSMGANMVLAPKQKNKIGEFLDNAISSANASVNSVVEQPVLQGVSNVLSRVAGSGYGKADIVGAIADIVASAPSGFIPSILNQVGQLTDQYARETKTSDFIQEITNKVKQRIPGLRQGLPIRYDTLGAPVFQFDPTTGGNNILNVFLNPSFPRTVKDTIVTQLVDDIYNKTGSTEQFPKVVGDKVQISVDGKTETLGLNSEQISQYQQYVGTRTEEAFKKLSLDPAFRKLSPEEQAKKMSDVMSTINSAAKIELFSSKPKTIDSKTRAVLRGKNAADYTTETATPQDKYQNALDKYDEDKAAGKISRFEDVKRTKELQTLKVGSNYTNDVLDVYSLSGKQIKTLMDEKAISQDLWNQVIAYGDELVAQGLIERNKFKDKYGNIYLPGTKEKGTGKGKGKRTISLKAPRLRRIKVSVPKARKVSFKQPTPTKARKSIKIKTG